MIGVDARLRGLPLYNGGHVILGLLTFLACDGESVHGGPLRTDEAVQALSVDMTARVTAPGAPAAWTARAVWEGPQGSWQRLAALRHAAASVWSSAQDAEQHAYTLVLSSDSRWPMRTHLAARPPAYASPPIRRMPTAAQVWRVRLPAAAVWRRRLGCGVCDRGVHVPDGAGSHRGRGRGRASGRLQVGGSSSRVPLPR